MLRTLSVFAILGITASSAAVETSCAVDDSAKSICGDVKISPSECVNLGCCFKESKSDLTPNCFYGAIITSGYNLKGLLETDTGYVGELILNGPGTSRFGQDLKKLRLEIIFETSDIARVKITDSSAVRWEVPESVVSRPHATKKPSFMNYKLSYTESPFSFEIVRVSDGRSLFKLDESFVFKDQYMEFSTSVDESAATFGLGESNRITQSLQPGTTHTLWSVDRRDLFWGRNMYSSMPYYLQMVDGAAHGALLMNSNGMDVQLSKDSLTFKTIGGIFDLYVFSGSSPAAVVDQYTQIVGRPTMMPYWSLGFHNCKYGYENIQQVEDVVANYSAAGIPLDTQWVDIDYMQNYKDFTLDSTNFPQAEVASFVDGLHANGQHFVPIIDPGIMVQQGYDAYEQGVELDLYVKDMSGGYYLGQVWPGPTHFPDFLHPSAQDYWTAQLKGFWNMAQVDGLWIDMNEVSNFCNLDGKGQVCVNSAPSGCPAPGASQTECCLVCTTVDSDNLLDFPPYSIHSAYPALATKTMPMSAYHYGNVSVYDAHNLYGLTEQIATNKALVDIRGKRPFILSRSSFPSTGVHSAKWTGDNGKFLHLCTVL